MKKEDLIRNLKLELSKIEKENKTYFTGETRYDLMIKDVLNYIENSIPKKAIENKIKKYKKEYEEILSEYGNIDTKVIINVPNKNVRKYLDKLIIKWTILEELLEGK